MLSLYRYEGAGHSLTLELLSHLEMRSQISGSNEIQNGMNYFASTCEGIHLFISCCRKLEAILIEKLIK